MENNWQNIADHEVRGVRRGGNEAERWSDPGWLVENTPPSLLFARFQDLAAQYEEGEEEEDETN